MRNFTNTVTVKGYIFNHNLTVRTTGPQSKNPGTVYINGQLNIATDTKGMNVVPVEFTYVTAYKKGGEANTTFTQLKQIIDENKTFEMEGMNATKVRVTGSVETNDFVTRDGQIASPKRIRGSFIHNETGDVDIVGEASFKTDMLIEKYVEVENDDDDNYGRLSGFIFNYKNDFIPVDYVIRDANGMKYFDGLDINSSNPILTNVWGNIVSTTIESRTEIESAFGLPTVKVSTRNLRSWDIVGAAIEPYEISEDGAMSEEDITKGKAGRAAVLDGVRQRYIERQNASNNSFIKAEAPVSQSPTESANYKF